ncbi:RNA polymerase sigma factor RpoD [subsurface metagenome]
MEENRVNPTEIYQANGALMAAIFGEKRIRCYPYIYQEMQEVGEVEEGIEKIFIASVTHEVVKVPLDSVIQAVLEDLNEKERQVLNLRFGLKDGKFRTHKEIAAEFKVSRTRIGQIIKRSFRKLRYPSRSRRLRGFLIPTQEERFLEKQRLIGLEEQIRSLNEAKELTQNKDREALEKDKKDLEDALEIAAANYQARWGGASPYRRVHNALRHGGITQLSQLKALNRRKLHQLRNVGEKSLDFLQEVLQTAEKMASP